jgi:hypothetical protein
VNRSPLILRLGAGKSGSEPQRSAGAIASIRGRSEQVAGE